MRFEISPLLPMFIAGIAADPLTEMWRFMTVMACVMAAYALGLYNEAKGI